MAVYGEYTTNDSIMTIYKNGKTIHVIENVNPETVFLHEDYHKSGKHYLDFDYKENDTELKASIEIQAGHSFRVFPSWMANVIKKNL